jgi:hypothetical protein
MRQLAGPNAYTGDKHVEAPPAMLDIREHLQHLERLIVCAGTTL